MWSFSTLAREQQAACARAPARRSRSAAMVSPSKKSTSLTAWRLHVIKEGKNAGIPESSANASPPRPRQTY
eukprot:5832161-Pyramimonas_sp.AAC.1